MNKKVCHYCPTAFFRTTTVGLQEKCQWSRTHSTVRTAKYNEILVQIFVFHFPGFTSFHVFLWSWQWLPTTKSSSIQGQTKVKALGPFHAHIHYFVPQSLNCFTRVSDLPQKFGRRAKTLISIGWKTSVAVIYSHTDSSKSSSPGPSDSAPSHWTVLTTAGSSAVSDERAPAAENTLTFFLT